MRPWWFLVLMACSGDGETPPTDGPTVTGPTCGDGQVDPGEGCDDARANADTHACTSMCQPAVCGDGLLYTAGDEQCDDGPGNDVSAPCTPECTLAVCGDGYLLDGDEECDDGAANSESGPCLPSCVAASCGDGWVDETSEQCDDGNVEDHDGCSADCQLVIELPVGGAALTVLGTAQGDGMGALLAAGADVGGDGIPDLVLGVPQHGPAGAAYLIAGGTTGTMSLADAQAVMLGATPDEEAGEAVDLDDLDGDGFAEILVGAPGFEDGGAVHVVGGPVTGTLDLREADGRLLGQAYTRFGASVAAVGDVNGDGVGDVLAGAPQYSEGSTSWSGAVYLAHGPIVGAVPHHQLAAKITGGWYYDELGSAVARAGDLNGDGLDDLLFASHDATLVMYSPISGTVDIAAADAEILGESFDLPGVMAGVGDVSGDGHDDLWIGDPLIAGSDDDTGAAYLVLGPVQGAVELRLADAKLVGEAAGGQLGSSVAGPGDVDGDGHPDLLAGARSHAGGDGAGVTYLLSGPVAGTVLAGDADVRWVGDAGALAGLAVAGAGDVDADGVGDLWIGAPGLDDGAAGAGGAYLWWGGSW